MRVCLCVCVHDEWGGGLFCLLACFSSRSLALPACLSLCFLSPSPSRREASWRQQSGTRADKLLSYRKAGRESESKSGAGRGGEGKGEEAGGGG